MKTCRDCLQEKDTSSFYNSKTKRDGFDPYCKSCRNHRAKLYQRKTGFKHPRRHNLKQKYGVTPEWYEEKLAEQNGLCAICGSDNPKHKQHFSIDHNHSTGKIRALLCNPCNVGLGSFQDSSDLLRRAAEYLDVHNKQEG